MVYPKNKKDRVMTQSFHIYFMKYYPKYDFNILLLEV